MVFTNCAYYDKYISTNMYVGHVVAVVSWKWGARNNRPI
jgi:hypothetical protein